MKMVKVPIPHAVQSFPLDPNSDKIDPEEIRLILAACLRTAALNVLEIGTYRGGTTANLATFAPKASIITVDVRSRPKTIPADQAGEVLPFCDIGSLIPRHLIAERRIIQRIIDPDNHAELSWAYQAGSPWDVVFVDGDHSYEGTRLAYELVKGHLSETGVILFHDCWWNVTPPPVAGPLRLLNEIEGCILNHTHVGATCAHAIRMGAQHDAV